jgi:predicted ArsR family transcriptional regulator
LLDEGLSREERLLLAWVSEHVPQSEIARWLGVSHAAARKQLERLRKRLAITAREYCHSISGREHDELEHFFRRLDATIDAERGEGAPSSNPKKVSNE